MPKHQGLTLKKILKVHDISTKDFAQTLGVSRQAVYGFYGHQIFKDDDLENFLSCIKKLVKSQDIYEEIVNSFKEEETVNNVDSVENIFIKTITNLEEQVNDLKNDKQKLYEQLSFYQSLLANQMGELKTLLMTREMSSSVGKWGEIEDSQPAFTVLKGEGTAKIVPLTPLFKVS